MSSFLEMPEKTSHDEGDQSDHLLLQQKVTTHSALGQKDQASLTNGDSMKLSLHQPARYEHLFLQSLHTKCIYFDEFGCLEI